MLSSWLFSYCLIDNSLSLPHPLPTGEWCKSDSLRDTEIREDFLLKDCDSLVSFGVKCKRGENSCPSQSIASFWCTRQSCKTTQSTTCLCVSLYFVPRQQWWTTFWWNVSFLNDTLLKLIVFSRVKSFSFLCWCVVCECLSLLEAMREMHSAMLTCLQSMSVVTHASSVRSPLFTIAVTDDSTAWKWSHFRWKRERGRASLSSLLLAGTFSGCRYCRYWLASASTERCG